MAGLKLLENMYIGDKQDWKLVGRKARVFLKKAEANYDELEELVQIQ